MTPFEAIARSLAEESRCLADMGEDLTNLARTLQPGVGEWLARLCEVNTQLSVDDSRRRRHIFPLPLVDLSRGDYTSRGAHDAISVSEWVRSRAWLGLVVSCLNALWFGVLEPPRALAFRGPCTAAQRAVVERLMDTCISFVAKNPELELADFAKEFSGEKGEDGFCSGAAHTLTLERIAGT